MEKIMIPLGNVKTESEAKDIVKESKRRLVYVIKLNKLDVTPNKFKFHIVKETKDDWGVKRAYPYYVYAEPSENKYFWIFQR